VAALTAITPVVTGVADAGRPCPRRTPSTRPPSVARGLPGASLNAGGSSDTVTISDFGTTSAGNALPSNTYTVTVANGTSKIIFIKPSQVNPTTGLVTVTHSFTTSVTYQLYPVQ
jgi:hypothetical protein